MDMYSNITPYTIIGSTIGAFMGTMSGYGIVMAVLEMGGEIAVGDVLVGSGLIGCVNGCANGAVYQIMTHDP